MRMCKRCRHVTMSDLKFSRHSPRQMFTGCFVGALSQNNYKASRKNSISLLSLYCSLKQTTRHNLVAFFVFARYLTCMFTVQSVELARARQTNQN